MNMNPFVSRGSPVGGLPIAIALCLLSLGAILGAMPFEPPASQPEAATLEQTRLAMNKYIETQRIISKERNDWQQGKEVLVSRLDLIKKEIESLEQKIQEAQSSAEKASQEREALLAENEQLKTGASQLTDAVTTMEEEVRRLHQRLPDVARSKIDPLFQRIPAEAQAQARVAIAERYQNVLGILNELNKLNNEITVNYEVHNLADGKPSEVKAIYVGLAQGYYVSAKGEAGIGRPTADGWKWEPSKELANPVLKTLEILQGTHTPAFVPLPVKIQ